MKIIRSLFALLFPILIVASSVSCAPRTLVASTNTPESTIIVAALTASPTAVPSATPTSTPVLTATEAAFSEERRAELDQQIKDFLNYQGEYSRENIKKYLLSGFSKDEFYNLGLIQSSVTTVITQCWLFDYFEKDGDLLLIAGFDGKDNQRFVTVISIPLHLLAIYPGITGMVFQKRDVWSIYSSERVSGTSADPEEITKYLFKNEPLLTGFVFDMGTEEQARELGGQVLVEIGHFYNENLAYTTDLANQIDQNGVELETSLKTESKEIKKIKSIEDLSLTNESDNTIFPVVSTISYNKKHK